jgi:hypothetical protein
LGNINPTLYALASSHPAAFHDVTTGSNVVPCTSGTVDCPSGTTHYGFSAGAGYDQVTGLGSVDASALAAAWQASLDPDFALTASTLNPSSVSAGQSASSVLTISPVSGSTGTVVNFSPSSCTGLPTGATCSFNPPSVTFDGATDATTTVTISTLPNMAASGPTTITITPTSSSNTTTTVSLTVTPTTESFTLATSNSASSYPVTVGGSVQVGINVVSSNFIVGTVPSTTTALPLTYTCTGTPSLSVAEIACQISPTNGQSVSATSVSLTFVTTPATSELRPPFGGSRVFYALLLPGLFGIVFAAGSGTRGLRLLSLIVVLGFSTLWLGSCGGSSGGGSSTIPPNAGTPPGNYTVTISATTGGAAPIANSNAPFTITLQVSAQ